VQQWTLAHSSKGFSIELSELPLRAYLVDRGWESLVSVLCVCCSKNPLSLLVEKLEGEDRAGLFVFNLINGPVSKWAWGKEKRVASFPVAYDFVASIDLEFAETMQRIADSNNEDDNVS
jgi:hypothetical protein